MQITKYDADQKLTAIIEMNIEPADYESAVNKILKQHQAKMAMPGFRQGHVPFGMVKRMYGESVRFDEINKLIQKELYDYIENNKLDIIGDPIPAKQEEENEFKEGENITLKFQIGLKPELDLVVDKNLKFNTFSVKVRDEDIEKTINNIKDQFSEATKQESIGDDSRLLVEMKELDEEGNLKENGIESMAEIKLADFHKKTTQDKLKKLVVDGKISLPLVKEIKDHDLLAKYLNLGKEELEKIESNFEVTIKEINLKVPAELNEELYKKAFPNAEIKTEEEFRTAVEKQLDETGKMMSNNYFITQMQAELEENLKFDLPEEFLKEWYKYADRNEEKRELTELEQKQFLKEIRWSLIESKILKSGDIKITQDEVREEFVNSVFGPQFKDIQDQEMKENLLKYADSMFSSNQDYFNNTYARVAKTKVADYLKENAEVEYQEVTIDELGEKFQELNKKFRTE